MFVPIDVRWCMLALLNLYWNGQDVLYITNTNLCPMWGGQVDMELCMYIIVLYGMSTGANVVTL